MGKVWKNKIFYLSVLLCFLSGALKAQEQSSFLLGIKPGFKILPAYNNGEIDINVAPLVFQKTLTKHIDMRVGTVMTLAVRKTGNQISELGVDIYIPYFFNAKTHKYARSEGFYVAPVISAVRNSMNNYEVYGFWIEPGYQFYMNDRYAFMAGLQYGVNYFNHEDRSDSTIGYFGVTLIFGFWL